MNCQEFRTATGADPRQSGADIEAHAAVCAECVAWRREMLRMDDVLRRALAIDFGATGATRIVADAPRYTWRGWAMAASVACATLVAGLLWFAIPRTTLADEVVAHMSEEPDAWARTALAANPAQMAKVLSRTGVLLNESVGLATYAHSCWFRGSFVPHLVFQTAAGPVTVMVLTEEHVDAPVAFDEQGYRGVLIPSRRGALAILGRDAEPGREFTARLKAAVTYTEE